MGYINPKVYEGWHASREAEKQKYLAVYALVWNEKIGCRSVNLYVHNKRFMWNRVIMRSVDSIMCTIDPETDRYIGIIRFSENLFGSECSYIYSRVMSRKRVYYVMLPAIDVDVCE